MRTIDFYLDLAKEKQNLPSDLALNRLMGFKGSMISHLRKSKGRLSDEKMIELCNLAGVSPSLGLLDLNIWRTSGIAQKVYKEIAQNANMLTISALALVNSNEAFLYIM